VHKSPIEHTRASGHARIRGECRGVGKREGGGVRTDEKGCAWVRGWRIQES
jgi:hypothetical protein